MSSVKSNVRNLLAIDVFAAYTFIAIERKAENDEFWKLKWEQEFENYYFVYHTLPSVVTLQATTCFYLAIPYDFL